MRTLDAFGKCILAGGIAAALLVSPGAAHARGYRILHFFTGYNGDGAGPNGVIKDKAGNLYGTTSEGGYYPLGKGVVFKIAPDGTETVLYTFCPQATCPDGANPVGSLIRDGAGNLYGGTAGGGANDCQCGVIFKLAPDRTETVFYSFCSQNNCSDGDGPEGGLVRDQAGNLYGTTGFGGTYYKGVVFKLAPDGTETVLYAFTGGSDGAEPTAGVIEDQSGNLYGTTYVGGAFNGGVVFKLAPDGTETVLHSFCSQRTCGDGVYPYAGVIEDQVGNLYGTTEFGGGGKCDAGATCGVIFEIAPDGTETVLHKFNNVDGAFPYGGLIRGTAGSLYGTTFSGGTQDDGVVFKLAPDGTERVLHSFAGGNDGKWPGAALIKDKTGNLYGATFDTVFKLRK